MTNDWLDFLVGQGATLSDGLCTSFGEMPADYPQLSATLTDLGDQGILGLEGPDTQRFLQGQSTSDTHQLDASTTLPGAICNPKGRMITSYQAIEPAADKLLLVMHRPLVDSTINSVGKYAAFFKTTLSNVSDQYRLLGISGPECEILLEKHFKTVPKEINQLCITEQGLLLRLCKEQFLVIVATAEAENLWKDLSSSFQTVGIDYWYLQSIQAGLAQVQAQTCEQFVPQMLNLQATGAVNFKKGCYTGQEIVARMQYLGKLKRRTYRLIVEDSTPPAKGAEIHSSDDNKLVGSVLMSAPANGTSAEILAVLHQDCEAATTLVIDGKTLDVSVAPLPYALAAN